MDCCQKQQNKRSKSFFNKKIFAFCILAVGAVFIAVTVFKVPISSLFTFGVLLFCPLMHFFMMKGHSMDDHQNHNEDTQNKEEVKQ